jgi:biopolymer transport protein ExbB
MQNLLSILLQSTVITADTVATSVQNGMSKIDELTLFGLLEKGGWIMIPIFILFFIALFLFIERYLYIRKTSRLDGTFLFSIREMLVGGNVQGAINYCKTSQFPIARLLEKGLNRLGSPINDIEKAIENTARVEIYNMEKNLGILSAIAKIAPMFGFLGTVAGMIRTFHDIATNGGGKIDIGTISTGIYEKMVTSAKGLIVGIIAYMFYTLLVTMIDRTVNKMEVTAIDFVDILHKPAHGKA